MYSPQSVRNELITDARNSLDEVKAEQDKKYNHLMALCILKNAGSEEGNILLEEEKQELGNIDRLIAEFEEVITKVKFWENRLEKLEKYDLKLFEGHFEPTRKRIHFRRNLNTPFERFDPEKTEAIEEE